MDNLSLVKQYVNQIKVMQLATCKDGQPYAVNIHFYADEDLNIYWISLTSRRHSIEIEENSKVCAALKVHENTEEENWVVGISVEGRAELLGQEVPEGAAQGFISKLNKDENLARDIASGENKHRWYVLRPSKIALFDNKTYPENPRVEINLWA
jgi:uncharacterized protein YhbP (UPF0306 family)